MSYRLLTGDGSQHGVVKHGAKEFAYYDYRHGAVQHTNTVEGFWKLFKASIYSIHTTCRASICSAIWTSSPSG